MTKNPSRKQSAVFIFLIPKVIRLRFSEWEAVVIVCFPRNSRGMRTRILVLIIPQVIRTSYLKFSECQWEVLVVLVVCRLRRRVKILRNITVIIDTTTMTMIRAVDLFGSIWLCLWLQLSNKSLWEESINNVVIARCQFDTVGECEETMMIW